VRGTQFNLSAIASAADMSTADQPEQCLVGSVKLTGGRVSGAVHLQLPQDFAAELTALLMGQHTASVSDEAAADVTGELCNMVAGRVAATLAAAGYSSILGTPVVARSRGLVLEAAPDAIACRSDWTCEGHLLTVGLQFSFKAR
jgi:CheY-specific phosphatase CheX